MKSNSIILTLFTVLLAACASTSTPAGATLDARTLEIMNEKLAPDSIDGKKITFQFDKAKERDVTVGLSEWKKSERENTITPVFSAFNVALGGDYEVEHWFYIPTGPKEAMLKVDAHEHMEKYTLLFKTESSGYATMEGCGEGIYWQVNGIIFSIGE